MCGASAVYGAHHPSATTCPCRTSMKLFMYSILSSASMHERTPEDETPCSSGVLRGSGAARHRDEESAINTTIRSFLTFHLVEMNPSPCTSPPDELIYHHAPITSHHIKSDFPSSIRRLFGSP